MRNEVSTVPAAKMPISAGLSSRAITSVCRNETVCTMTSATAERTAPRRRVEPSDPVSRSPGVPLSVIARC